MRANKLKILCQGFWWNKELIKQDYYKMSFIANETQPGFFTPELDLMNYIEEGSLGDIEFNFEELALDESGNTKEKYFLASEFSFNVINGIYEKYAMQTEFGVWETKDFSMEDFLRVKKDTTYIKYKVRVMYNYGYGTGTDKWRTIYKGCIEQDGIEATYSKDNNNGIIKIQVIGYEKQFKEYFEKQPLPIFTSLYGLHSTQYQIKERGNDGTPYNRSLLYCSLKYAFFSSHTFHTLPNELFFDFNISIEFEGITYHDYTLIEEPHFIKYGGTNWNPNHPIFYRNGYNRAFADGENLFGFVKKLCNSMGWIFFFAMVQPPNPNSDYELHFCIRDRFNYNSATPFTIDNNKIDESGITISKASPETTVSVIVIPDGEFKGGYARKALYDKSFIFASPYFWGNRIVVLDESSNLPLSGTKKIIANHFDNVRQNGDEYDNISFHPYSQLVEKNDNEYKFKTIGNILSNYYIDEEGQIRYTRDYAEPIDIKSFGYSLKDVLIINAGVNKVGRQVDATNMVHSDLIVNETSQTSERAMWFTGNYGEMLSIEAGQNNVNTTYCYNDIIQTDEFKNNFLKFKVSHANMTVGITYLDILTNPNQSIKFLNNEVLGNEKFALAKMIIKLESGKTKLTLTK